MLPLILTLTLIQSPTHPVTRLALKAKASAARAVAPFPNEYLAKPPAAGKVLVTVNGLPIRASELEAYLWDWRGYEALQDAISYRLVEQAATRAGVVATKEETDKAIKMKVDEIQKSAPKGKSLDQSLREQGYPMSRLVLRVRSEVLLDKLVLKDLKRDEFVKVSTIIFHPDSEQTPALSAAIRRADDAYQKLQKGSSWDVVLNENESDQRALKSRGMLGWRKLSSFPPTVAAELSTLKVGAISKPAQTLNGIQFFRMEGHGSDAKGADLEEMKSYFLNANGPTVLSKIRETAKIERFFP